MSARIFALACLFSLLACTSTNEPEAELPQNWEGITESARNSEVNFMMWQGSPVVNDYINNYVRPALQERYGIELTVSGGQGPEIVKLVMGERQASVDESQVDMVWINGETFFQLRQLDGLYGPFVENLPNAAYVNFDDPFIHTDFQQAVNGMEAPWGISQFALVYDSASTQNPPVNLAELEDWLEQNPGRFTISNDFSGMTLLKSFLAEIAGGREHLQGDFNAEKYEQWSAELWNFINRNKHNFWKAGATFPKEHSQLDQMFASGELLISYGFNEGDFEDKVREGLFPKSTRAYAWESGTIKNANYLGILHNAGNKAGAMVAINFLMSPEAQLKKMDPEGMGRQPVLDQDKLPNEWQQRFSKMEERRYAPSSGAIADRAMQEPAPEYMIRLFDDFRSQVIEK